MNNLFLNKEQCGIITGKGNALSVPYVEIVKNSGLIKWYNWKKPNESTYPVYGNNNYAGSVAYGNGKFVAACGYYISYSEDGINWATVKHPSGNQQSHVIYSNDKFVAAGGSSSNTGDIIYSTDGINWAAANLGFRCAGLAYGNNMYVAVSGQTNMNCFAYSSDGINWTRIYFPSYFQGTGIAFGGGRFVMIGYSNGNKDYWTSTDGINWARLTLPYEEAWSDIVYGNGKFIAFPSGYNKNNNFIYSEDGLTWAQGSMPTLNVYWRYASFGNGMFIVLGYTSDGSNIYAYSTDGINWTASTLPSSQKWSCSCYGDNKIVFLSGGSNSVALIDSSSPIVYTDTDTPTTESEVYSKPDTIYETVNAIKVGYPTISDEFVVSNFSTSNYLKLPTLNANVTIILKIKTGSNVSSGQYVVCTGEGTFWFDCMINSGYFQYWNVNSSKAVNISSVSANTIYWIKIKLTSNNTKSYSFSTDGITYTDEYLITDQVVFNTNLVLGLHGTLFLGPFLGDFYLNDSYAIDTNGNEIWRGAPVNASIASTGYSPNAMEVGNITFDTTAGIASGFSSSNYFINDIYNLSNSSWEYKLKVLTGSDDIVSERSIIDTFTDQTGIRIGTAGTVTGRWELLVSSGSSWINTSSHYGSYKVLANTTYWLKAGYDLESNEYYLYYSLNGIDYIKDVSYTSSSQVSSVQEIIGGCRGINWSGSIDLSECSLNINDEEVWRGVTKSITLNDGYSYDRNEAGDIETE